MKLYKDEQMIVLTQQAHIDAYKKFGWKEKSEPKQEEPAEEQDEPTEEKPKRGRPRVESGELE